MYAEQMPFTFLMPADEAIYRPFQFAFICDQESWEESEELSVCAADGKAGEAGRIREQAGTRTADSAGGVPQTGLSQMGDSQIVRVKAVSYTHLFSRIRGGKAADDPQCGGLSAAAGA